MRIKVFLALVLFAATAVATRADTVFPTNLLVTAGGFCIPDDPYGPGLGCSPVDLNLNIAVRPALDAPAGYVEVVDVTGQDDVHRPHVRHGDIGRAHSGRS